VAFETNSFFRFFFFLSCIFFVARPLEKTNNFFFSKSKSKKKKKMKMKMKTIFFVFVLLAVAAQVAYGFFPMSREKPVGVHLSCHNTDGSPGAPNKYAVNHVSPQFAKQWKDVDGVGGGRLYTQLVPHDGERTNTSQTFPVLHVYGSAYQQGFAHGTLLKQEALRFFKEAWSYVEAQALATLEKYLPPWFAAKVAEMGMEGALDFTYELQKAYTGQDVFDEMQGLADATGIDVRMIRRLSWLPSLTKGACSNAGLWAGAMANGHTVQLRALDWDMSAVFRDHSLVIVYHQDAMPSSAENATAPTHTDARNDPAHSYALVGLVGFVGALTGQSAAQLAVSEIGVSYPDPTFGKGQDPEGAVPVPGVPFVFLLRDILKYDASLSDAWNRMAMSKRTCDLVLGVGDGKLEQYRDFQYSTKVLRGLDPFNFLPDNDKFNSYHPFLANDVMYRFDDWSCYNGNLFMYNTLKAQYGSITIEYLIERFASGSGTGTNHLAWYDLTDQSMYVAFAAPSSVGGPFYGYWRQFTQFNLTELFSVSLD
jgi:hypothetical protein